MLRNCAWLHVKIQIPNNVGTNPGCAFGFSPTGSQAVPSSSTRQIRLSGSVRGVRSNPYPYRDLEFVRDRERTAERLIG